MSSTFGFLGSNVMVNRLPKNSLDFCTVVNIYPRDIHELKHTLEPGVFDIPAGSYEKPGLLKVFGSSWWRDFEGRDAKQPPFEVQTPSMVVANSIVQDYINGMFCFSPTQKPGLFYVPGDFNKSIPEHKKLLDEAREHQINWYKELVKEADKLWARTNGNPLAISADMKLASKELNLTEKDWLRDYVTMEMIRCKACTTLVRAESIVCSNCKVVLDEKRFASLGMKFAS